VAGFVRQIVSDIHLFLAVVAVLAAVGQVLLSGRARRAGTRRQLQRVVRGMGWACGVSAGATVLTVGAGFSLLGGLWSMADAWVAAAAGQATGLLLVLVAVVLPPLREAADLAADTAGTGEDDGAAAARVVVTRPMLVTGQAATPLVLVGIAYLMVQKPPLLGVAEAVAVTAAAIGACWVAARRAQHRAPLRGIRRVVRAAAVVVAVTALAAGYWAWRADVSRLPASVAMGAAMPGMGGMPGHEVSLPTLTGPAPAADATVDELTLTARAEHLALPGEAGGVDAWRFDDGHGNADLTVTQGDEVVVHLVNQLPVPTTIHWHGVNVPAAQDGVAGVTQDAVAPGATFTYRFRADQAGTFWYHAHQNSSQQIACGLFGSLVVNPRTAPADAGVDHVVPVHTWDTGHGAVTTLGDTHVPAAPGRPVRLRILDTDSRNHRFTLVGAAFTVGAIDGTDLHEPGPLTGTAVTVPAAGRYDITFAAPASGAATLIDLDAPGQPSVTVGGTDAPAAAPAHMTDLDITAYGVPAPGPAMTAGIPTRRYTVSIDQHYGFYDGHFGEVYSMNGDLFPHGPMLTVHDGDLVQVRFVNRTEDHHPMHLHGHHFTVVDHDDHPITGSPLVLDTLDVGPYESWTVVFRADNPGLWMFHCHNLDHAAMGMDLMVDYDTVTTPYVIGTASGNRPE
jgi:FtsP/CotA-like multicopper oxidase with cupredoxin domain